MAYKINGTTVVDNSRNVCACCVTSCCITASDRMDAPSGTTAQRPSSPATGSVYFDTDLGALISYDGSNWIAPSGGVGAGLSSGLVNSDTEAWSATFLNTDSVQCRGCQQTCIYGSVCGFHRCTSNWFPQYSSFSGRVTGNDGEVGCYAYQYAYNCFERSSLRHLSKYGMNRCYPCIPWNFLCGICTQICLGYASCRGMHARIFHDGSFEQYVATSNYNYICGCSNDQRSLIFDKYGNNHIHHAQFAVNETWSGCGAHVPENSFAYQEYMANGLNAPLGNFKQTIQMYAGATDDYPMCDRMCAAFEICSDYLHQNGYEVCDTLLIPGSPYASPCFCKYRTINTYSAATAFYPLETGFKLGQINYDGHCICLCGAGVRYGGVNGTGCFIFANIACCCGDNFTYLSKCPQYNYRDPSFYTVRATLPSGAKLGTSDEGYTNSMGYMRITHVSETCLSSKDKGLYGGAGCASTGWNSFYWFSQDRCKLYHIYFRHCTCGSGWAKFSCSACQSVAGDKCFNNDYWPATEVIDTTNGCVICSVYYCQYKDCQIPGSTYPYALCLTSCCTGFYCAAPFHTQASKSWGQRAPGIFSWLEGNVNNIAGATSCMIRSCACPARVYMVPQPGNQCGNIRVSVFNECTLNFECSFPALLFSTNQVCCNLGKLQSASTGCCCSIACVLCTFQCEFTNLTTPPCRSNGGIWPALNCSWMPNNVVVCCLRVRGFDWYCHQEYSSGNYYYINPTNDHLVMMLSIGKCNTSSCSQPVYWLGAVCWDIENCCLSRVETLYPTSGDKCIKALVCGPKQWGTCHPCDMTSASQVEMCASYCICTTNLHCSRLAIAKTWGTLDHESGGVTVVATGMLGLEQLCVCSTCCRCNGNSCFDECFCFGHFGKCGYGGCVFRNTCCNTGSGPGLHFGPTFGIARIPWEQKLSCSGLFEEDAGMKCLFEMMLGCHNMGCSLYCNKQCCIDKIYCNNFTPEFNCIVDITCQFSSGCTGIYTWGSTCWCSRRRWVIFDVGTTCLRRCQNHVCCCTTVTGSFASWMCCDPANATACWDSFKAACDACCYQVFTGWCCYSQKACNNWERIPTVLMCVNSDTVFSKMRDHRQLSNPSGINFIQGYDQVGLWYPNNNDNYHPGSSGGHYGWYSYQTTPCCKWAGLSGSMKYWFDNHYAKVL